MGKRRFAGSIKGDDDKTEASRYTNGPIVAHIRGWDFGIKVRGMVGHDNQDQFEVILTGGSNAAGKEYSLGWFTQADLDTDIGILRRNDLEM